MRPEQLRAKCSLDSGDGCGLQKEYSPTPLPGHYPLPGPQVGNEHQLPQQESKTEDVLPTTAEEIQPAKDNDGALLHSHHSILTSSITIWYAAATVKDKSRLQRIICTAEKAIGCNLPTLKDLHTSRTLRRIEEDCGRLLPPWT